MPSIVLEVPETYDSITRPVAVGMVRDLINRLDLPNDDDTIKFLGSAEKTLQTASALANKNNNPSFPFTGEVRIELDEEYLEDGILTTAVQRRDNNAIFDDPRLLVHIRPVYTKTQATVSLRYRTPNRNFALRWRDTLRRKMTQGTQAMLHELIYHYSTPAVFHRILEEIHRLRENVAGYNEDFNTWLRNCYDERMTILSNLSGSRGLVSIPEKQIQVQGWLSFITEPPEPTKTQEGETWEVGFDYTY